MAARKICDECGTSSTSRWYKNNTQCASCNKKAWYIKNKDKALKKSVEWNDRNSEVKRGLNKNWYDKNRDHRLAKNKVFKEVNPNYQKDWKVNNLGKLGFYSSKYRATKLNASVNGFDDEILEIYEMAKNLKLQDGVNREVHHIVPLQQYDEIICGLHVPWNLEILTEEEHLKAHEELRKVYGRTVDQ
jgi:uncharacterized Zn finger protein (UPF0148 family)